MLWLKYITSHSQSSLRSIELSAKKQSCKVSNEIGPCEPSVGKIPPGICARYWKKKTNLGQAIM